MHRVGALGFLLWASSALAQLPAGEQILHTKDGRELRGTVVSQTETGYLLKTATGTFQIPFADIQDLLPADGTPQPLPAPPPPPPQPLPEPGYDAPPPSAAPGEPQPPQGEPPPPQPTGPDWRDERKGFHWSLGAGGMIDPGLSGSGSAATFSPAYFVGAVPAVRYGFGWIDLQGEIMPLGYFKSATKAFFLGVNPQVRFNFARFYSLGVGFYGAVVFSRGIDFTVGTSLSPAIIRIGDLGQHEIRLWLANQLLATSNGLLGLSLWMLSYSYVF